MASTDHKVAPGHYSGHNPIPNVKKFVEGLDKEKKERDKRIDEAAKSGKAGTDVRDHVEDKPKGKAGTRKTVTDPVTGREVEIEDVNADFMKAVDDPQASQITQLLGVCQFNKTIAVRSQCKSRQAYNCKD